MTRARSARLRQIRNARGKSLRVVAGLAGMSPAHLSRRPAEALRARVTTTIDALWRCERERDVGTALPSLIRDLHTTIAAGRDVAELLSLGAWLHPQATVPWLSITAAPVDLRWQALMLAQHAAGDRNTVATAGLVAAASARVGLAAGAVDLPQAVLDAVTVPTNTPQSMQLAGFLALRRSIIAAADGRSGDVEGPVEYATDLAERTGESNAYRLGFGPIKVGLYRMSGLLEIGDSERAATLAESLTPQAHVNRSGQAAVRVPSLASNTTSLIAVTVVTCDHRRH